MADRYVCSKGCGARRNSWIAITMHEMSCTGGRPKSKKPPRDTRPR